MEVKTNKQIDNLIFCSGMCLEALLAEAAHTAVICDRCILKAECDARPAGDTCQEIWLDYLKGEKTRLEKGLSYAKN